MQNQVRPLYLSILCVTVALVACNTIRGNATPEDTGSGGKGGESTTSSSGDGDASGDGDMTSGSMGDGDMTSGGGDETSGDGDMTTGEPAEPEPEGCYQDGETCVPWTNCKPGEWVESVGTDREDQKCTPCGAGTFSDDYNSEECSPCTRGFSTEGADECTPWTACDWDQVLKTEGDAQTDTTCDPGAFFREFDSEASDRGLAVAVDADENVYVLGSTNADPEDLDVDTCDQGSCRTSSYVIKYNAQGEQQWIHFLTSNEGVEARDVAVDSQGDVYIGGFTEGDLVGKNQGSTDGFLIKMDGNQNVLWSKPLATTESDTVEGLFIDKNDRVYAAGGTRGILDSEGAHFGENDMFVSIFNPDGSLVSSHQFGDEQDELASAVAVDGDGLVYLAGKTYSQPFHYQYLADGSIAGIPVIIFDPTDSPINPFAHLLSFSDLFQSWSSTIVPLGGGDFMLGGFGTTGKGGTSYVGLYDINGSLKWDELIEFPSGLGAAFKDLVPTDDGEFLVINDNDNYSGTSGMRDVIVHKIDATGAILWSEPFGTEDLGNSALYSDESGRSALGPRGHLYVPTSSLGSFSSDGSTHENNGQAVIRVDVAALDQKHL